MNLFFFLGNVGTVLFIAAIFSITPVLNRKSLLFGVRIPEAATDLPECKRLKNGYYTIIIIGCLLVVAASVALYLRAPEYSLLCWLYFPFIMIGVQLAAFIPQWKKARVLKADRGWIVPLTGLVETRSAASRERLNNMRWGWYAASLALSLILTVWTAIVYPSLPDRIITHRNTLMQPDQWGDKSWLFMMSMPVIAFLFVLMMAACNIIVYRQKLQVSAEYPAQSFAQHRIYRRMLGRSLGFMTFCFTAMFALMQPAIMSLFTPPASYIPMVIAITCVLGIIPVIYVPIKAGQSGCRLKPVIALDDTQAKKVSIDTPGSHSNQGDDRFWKLGMFYYNPDDPSVLVEDRFGGNGGFNYARLPSKIFVAVIALIIILSYCPITVLLLKYPIK